MIVVREDSPRLQIPTVLLSQLQKQVAEALQSLRASEDRLLEIGASRHHVDPEWSQPMNRTMRPLSHRNFGVRQLAAALFRPACWPSSPSARPVQALRASSQRAKRQLAAAFFRPACRRPPLRAPRLGCASGSQRVAPTVPRHEFTANNPEKSKAAASRRTPNRALAFRRQTSNRAPALW